MSTELEEDAIVPATVRTPHWRRMLLVALVVCGALVWYVWPATRGERVDVVVVGDGAVQQAKDELERRFRQEGLVPSVVVVAPADCNKAVAATPSNVAVVISFGEAGGCAGARGGGTIVQQPGGQRPSAPGSAWTVRPAAPLFGADSMPCQWWDTPGAGEARPGLGQCGPDGLVRLQHGAELTPAGRERFARLVVEAVR